MVTEQLGRDSPLQAGSHTISHAVQDTDKKWRISRLILGRFVWDFHQVWRRYSRTFCTAAYLTLPSVWCLVHVIVFHWSVPRSVLTSRTQYLLYLCDVRLLGPHSPTKHCTAVHCTAARRVQSRAQQYNQDIIL